MPDEPRPLRIASRLEMQENEDEKVIVSKKLLKEVADLAESFISSDKAELGTGSAADEKYYEDLMAPVLSIRKEAGIS
jgi:hypothetical protein